MADMNRQWLLRRRPSGMVTPDDFEYREDVMPTASLAPGEVLLKNRAFLCPPTMRNWMDPPGNNLYPSIPLGAPVLTLAACDVVASTRDDLPVGTRVTAFTSWQDYQVAGAANLVEPFDESMGYTEVLASKNWLTGYFGLTKVGRPKAGETLVVSGAAGSNGSVAAQIGKIMGCRVIGIAGGAEKCAWLADTCHLDAVIDYKSESVAERIKELCPKGIDIFYDNVGGEVLQVAIDNMAKFGRIVLCGQIATYNEDGPARGPNNMMRLVYGSVTMQGFLMHDYYAAEGQQAIKQILTWIKEGKIAHREDVRPGFKLIPQTFAALFDGSNSGTLIALVD